MLFSLYCSSPTLREKCLYSFYMSIFSFLFSRIRDEYLSPDAGKYGPEKLEWVLNTSLFTIVKVNLHLRGFSLIT